MYVGATISNIPSSRFPSVSFSFAAVLYFPIWSRACVSRMYSVPFYCKTQPTVSTVHTCTVPLHCDTVALRYRSSIVCIHHPLENSYRYMYRTLNLCHRYGIQPYRTVFMILSLEIDVQAGRRRDRASERRGQRYRHRHARNFSEATGPGVY